MSNLLMRVLTAVIFAAVALFLTWEGGFLFALFAWCVGGLVLFEWRGIAKSCWRLVDEIVASLAYVIFGVLLVFDFSAPLIFIVIALCAVILAIMSLKNAGWVAGGFIYATLPVASLTFIRGEEPFGFGAIIFLFAIVWGTDIAAYFNGRSLGGPKLAPKFSPNKTWSGAIGGALAGTAGGCLVAFFALDTSPANFFIPVLSLALSVISQIGDISESWVKRKFGVKDSGHFLPGHGGFMDRVDGLVFAAILLYLVGAIAADMAVPSNMFNLI
ncbi:phosphatidate cytidylyltransferase [uncultured Bartonella sp.]|uniref:phosphatidate cytidylyltransferase n=1 Tax=uncultured Bartonella sp. TaxID=104108 RepID=UPI0025E6CEA4|nr:phosphatidate cytidylyltransferase [uncultured Bartonella sp.]